MAYLQLSEGPNLAESPKPGKQLLNHMVDNLARLTPSAVWAEIPVSTTDYERGFRKITYRMLANAVNGVAWWIHQSLGPGYEFETLAYFGPWDIRYVLLLLGAVKAGYKMVFPSPVYSTAGLAALLGELHCKTILAPSTSPKIVHAVIALHSLKLVKVQEVEELLAKDHPHFAFEKTFENARQEPLVVLHTSGSTSHPKPVLWTHDYAASVIQQNQLEPPPNKESVGKICNGKCLVPLLPAYHCGSLFTNLFTTIPNQTTTIYPVPSAALSADTLVDVLTQVDADVAIVTPLVAQQIATDPVKLDFVFSKLSALGFAGGNLSKTTGDTLARRGDLFPVFGATENGTSLTLRDPAAPAVDTWACMDFHPKAGYKFRYVGDSCYEAEVIRNTLAEDEQPVFKVFPQLQKWSTKDLFTPHPKTSGAWIYKSRADSIIVFADGTSFNPLEYEQLISGHASVRTALMLGSQRPQGCLLVELVEAQDLAEADASIALESLWPLILQANECCTKQSAIMKPFVLFTKPEKPLPRGFKGTVQRSVAMKLYADELDKVFDIA